MSGSIKIIIGNMFSGKSTEMIRIVNRFGFLNIPVLAISHSLDNRYDTGKIVTHNQQKYDCHSTNTLMPLIETDIFKNCQVVAIEEAQFFPDLFEFVTRCADEFGKFAGMLSSILPRRTPIFQLNTNLPIYLQCYGDRNMCAYG